MFDLIIKNGMLYDGTGAAPFTADIAVKDGRIAAVGDLSKEAAQNIYDAAGKAVSPGFIDCHSHGDVCIGNTYNSLSRVSQGITTQIAGLCGGSVCPANAEMAEEQQSGLTPSPGLDDAAHFATFQAFLEYADSLPQIENTAMLIGQGNLRRIAMGYSDSIPTEKEMAHMKAMLREAMEHGALGLSSGLIYVPGAYAKTEELTELCKEVARYNGIYDTHMRNESDTILSEIQENIEISKNSECRLHISHLKICGKQNHGTADQILALIDRARAEGISIEADQYPYIASSTGLDACIPPKYFTEGIPAFVEKLKEPAVRQIIRKEILMEADAGSDFENIYINCGGSEGILLTQAEKTPEAVGKTLTEYAAARGIDEIEAIFELLIENDCEVSAVFYEIGEEDMLKILKRPDILVGSDGVIFSEEEMDHPRTFGTFTRALGRYAREKEVMPMETMIRKMTGLAAEKMGLTRKGILKEGMDADLLVFDPEAVMDCATYVQPKELSVGIECVWIAGEKVYENGKLTGNTPGRVLRAKNGKVTA